MTGENELLGLADEPFARRVTFTPEPEAQRGRKRRRTPVPFAITTTAKTLSGDSATFRGRSPHRATSLVARSGLSSAFSSRNSSGNRVDRSASPSRKKHFRFPPPGGEPQRRRRSQSPSRSRSRSAMALGGGDVSVLFEGGRRRRRRQRTRSRGWSRDRGITSHPASAAGAEVTSLASSLRVVELVVDSDVAREQGDVT